MFFYFQPLFGVKIPILTNIFQRGWNHQLGTYVLAHAYHDDSINRCLDAGVRCIEHGFLMSESTMKRIADEGAAISLQCVMSMEAFADPEKITFFTKDQKKKAALVASGAKQMMEHCRKYKPLTVSGGDMFGGIAQHRQADNIICLVTLAGFSPVEALRTATSDAAKVLSWSTGMNPYKDGALGVIKPGAYADLILVDGNPLEEISCLKREKIHVVIKDGVCYKYKLPAGRAPDTGLPSQLLAPWGRQRFPISGGGRKTMRIWAPWALKISKKVKQKDENSGW